jgi:vancomycin permeability regulator SanA
MCGLSIVTVFSLIYVFGVDFYMVSTTRSQILESTDLTGKKYDCILVLGAGVWDGNKPSPMLEDRLLKGIELFEAGVSSRLLMSGDHGRPDYDEVNVMKDYAKAKGILSSSIFMDHAGFSTFDSLYRAREIFKVKSVLIVTQEYHLYRALYIARQLGLDAQGVAARKIVYAGQWIRDLREILARNKDFVKIMFHPKASIMGDPIPIDGNGDNTND